MSSSMPSVSVVDDDAEVRAALARLVASTGFEADAYPGGAEFLQALERHRPDCVVLDLQMPGTSGFEVLQAIAGRHLDLPVIAITGYDSPNARAKALGLGARTYLCKPVDDQLLLAAIAAAVARG